MDDLSQGDICRVCRCEGQSDRPLFHPCICTGSIKWIHQDCLTQWMRYSRKEYCELCGHRFSFTPIYSPDMPRVLPLRDVAGGLLSSVGRAAKHWFHYTLVAVAWLGIVPFTAYRTYRFMFNGLSFDTIFSLPYKASDVLRGCFVVTCTLLSFIGLVWLREQIFHGAGPDWLERDDPPQQNEVNNDVAVNANNEPVDDAINNNNNENNNNEGEAPVDVPMDNAQPPQPDADAAEPENDLANGNDEANWNPMELDRAAEELTWERLLGLDGSMVFLEHVFWVMSLNTLSIFMFAFLPHCIGSFVISYLGLLRPDKVLLHFHGLLTTLFGYCIIGMTLLVLHSLARLLQMRKIRRFLGLCYIVVKVSLLSVVEVGGLPLICGWWLDICSLPMFDASIKDRKASFLAAPGTSLFIHWMFGMVYVYYFASVIVLLREVLRPGVLWFLRDLNDPDFSPIQEMIHLSILRHARRFLASAIIFGSVVMLMLWLPTQILKSIWPSFLPYTLSGDAEVNELSLQLLLLQIILPGFFEQSHTRNWLKGLLRIWCTVVSWVLGIRSYLLGNELQADTDDAAAQQRPQPDHAQGWGAAHQAFLERRRNAPIGFQPYERPTLFPLRLLGLIFLMCCSLVVASLVVLTVPVWIGRQCMVLWSMGGQISTPLPQVPTAEASTRHHELYTAAIGTYLCYILSRGIAIAVNLLPQGRQAVVQKVKHWLSVGASYALAALIFVLMLGVIPLMFGLLLELVLVIPLRVPLYQTPIHFLWQDWTLGVLYTKIACALTVMGPDWRLKRAIERACQDGLRDIDLRFIIRELAAPVITCFGLALAIPYVIGHSVVPLFVTNQYRCVLLARQIYPFFLVCAVIISIGYFQIRQFKKLYVAIKNDKYLVGQRLVNYDHRKKKSQDATATDTTSSSSASPAVNADVVAPAVDQQAGGGGEMGGGIAAY